MVFAEQVARSPEAVAVTAVGGSMTYRELDAAANRLAHLLTGLGVGAGQRVGCCCPVGRGDCGDRGRPEDGGGVCADGSGAPAGAVEVFARGCRAGRRGHHRGAG
ncbi:AMP-binding enzyme family protein [Mycobacterium xenopi 4042]|uniref:AMP-binding enzyme family protein n=1 Tax=Mycobacterium xenopi 4042 TaxID=1299334 RepID=X8E8B6_MYCXE|nr:AMP-binding enzyme family protein [Mycobacterium xenopi 4042]